jgi:hypothetical protein
MSTLNPTLLRVGMKGPIDNRAHTVRCRVVLSVRIKGESYYWNEYILDDGSGELVTLCYEEDETGCVWRLFSELNPLRALSAREAASKKVGDEVDLGRGPLRVTSVDRSRVAYVEGDPPDWLAVGDEADFFNAEENGHMLVVSWTGEEVEYYYGGTISRRRVAETFGLPRLRDGGRPASTADSGARSASASGRHAWTGWLVLIGIVGTMAAVFLLPLRGSDPRPAPPAKKAAPEYELPVSSQGALPELGRFQIEGRSLVEVGELGARFERHEYALRLPGGEKALLVDVAAPDAPAWLLLRTIPAPSAWTPSGLAALRVGQPLQWGGERFSVARIQGSRLLSLNGEAADLAKIGEQRYGLIAREPGEWLIARWSATELTVYRGRDLSERDVRQAFVER